jgi:hypothetical protein
MWMGFSEINILDERVSSIRFGLDAQEPTLTDRKVSSLIAIAFRDDTFLLPQFLRRISSVLVRLKS